MIAKLRGAGEAIRTAAGSLRQGISTAGTKIGTTARRAKDKVSRALAPAGNVIKEHVKDRAQKAVVDVAAATAAKTAASVGKRTVKAGVKDMLWGSDARKVATSTVALGGSAYVGGKVTADHIRRKQKS
jgi:hypothetical protein